MQLIIDSNKSAGNLTSWSGFSQQNFRICARICGDLAPKSGIGGKGKGLRVGDWPNSYPGACVPGGGGSPFL